MGDGAVDDDGSPGVGPGAHRRRRRAAAVARPRNFHGAEDA